MMNKLVWKRSIDYYGLHHMRLERECAELRDERNRLRRCLIELNEKPAKKYSRYFVVFNQDKEGKYHSPQIVEADSAEEALCPEGSEEARAGFCHRLWDVSEYSEL